MFMRDRYVIQFYEKKRGKLNIQNFSSYRSDYRIGKIVKWNIPVFNLTVTLPRATCSCRKGAVIAYSLS